MLNRTRPSSYSSPPYSFATRVGSRESMVAGCLLDARTKSGKSGRLSRELSLVVVVAIEIYFKSLELDVYKKVKGELTKNTNKLSDSDL
jgi:hypothetical protein